LQSLSILLRRALTTGGCQMHAPQCSMRCWRCLLGSRATDDRGYVACRTKCQTTRARCHPPATTGQSVIRENPEVPCVRFEGKGAQTDWKGPRRA
jgi:hypothetical protein